MNKTIIIGMMVLMSMIGIASAVGENCSWGDCGTCEYCDQSNTCVYQSYGGDIKDECPFSIACGGNFANKYHYYWQTNGICDGSGSCVGAAPLPVDEGNVCINETHYNENPNAEYHCGIWSDCVENETSADEYYVGFLPGTNGLCSATDWQSAGTTQEATEGYWWDTTQQVDTCTEELTPCSDDYDCGTCHVCNSGVCEAAPFDTDPKDDCEPTWDCGGYSNNSVYRSQPGNCISGYCRHGGWYPGDPVNVSDGNICIEGVDKDTDPTASYNAGVWSDCVAGETTADEYYVGYCSGTPCDTDWVSSGTTWIATSGFRISQTENVDSCQEVYIPTQGGGSGGGYVTVVEEPREEEATPVKGVSLTDEQKKAIFVGLGAGALGIIGYNAGWFGKTASSIRRRRKR